MPVIGITGGIATGKSTLVEALLKLAPAEAFDADRCVRGLLEGDPGVRAAVIAAFGEAVLDASGMLHRARLREQVFHDDASRARLEAILHPLVRHAWSVQAGQCRAANVFLYADVPLLFETGGGQDCDRVIVVACSPETQRARMRLHRGLAPELIERMIGAQLDLATKVARADHVVWNDSTTEIVEEQARLLNAWLRQHYG